MLFFLSPLAEVDVVVSAMLTQISADLWEETILVGGQREEFDV